MDTLPAVRPALKELYTLKSIDIVQFWFITIYRMFIKAINFFLIKKTGRFWKLSLGK